MYQFTTLPRDMIYITDGDGTKGDDYEDNSGNDDGVSDDSDDSTIPSGDPSAEEEDSLPPHKKITSDSSRGAASKPVGQRDTVLRSGSNSLIQEQHLPIVSAEVLRTLQNLPKVQSLQQAGHASVFKTAQLLGSLRERQAAVEGGVPGNCEQETSAEKLHLGQRSSQMEAPQLVSLTK